MRNAQRDAEDIAGVLSELGFDVLECYEAGYGDMKSALSEFTRLAPGYDVALFYYAGHGLQDNSKNYLIPIDAKLEMRSELDRCLHADDVLQQMEESGVASRVVMLDACRNTPRAWSRSSENGLARMEGAAGSVILFSTGSGNVALDGEGDNSPFAQAVMANMVRPRVQFTRAVNDIVNDTYDYTSEAQYPLLVGTLRGDFRFNSAGRSITIASAGSSVKPQPIPTANPASVSSNISTSSAPAQSAPAPEPAGPEIDFDSDLEVAVESCKRSGSNLYIILKFTNPTNEDIEFRFSEHGSKAIDNAGNEYKPYSSSRYMEFGKGKTRECHSAGGLNLFIPSRGLVKMTAKLSPLDGEATAISMLYLYEGLYHGYPALTIRNIPIQKGKASFLSSDSSSNGRNITVDDVERGIKEGKKTIDALKGLFK